MPPDGGHVNLRTVLADHSITLLSCHDVMPPQREHPPPGSSSSCSDPILTPPFTVVRYPTITATIIFIHLRITTIIVARSLSLVSRA